MHKHFGNTLAYLEKAGKGVLVDSWGTLDKNRKLAMSISIRNSQYTLRGRNDLSHMIS